MQHDQRRAGALDRVVDVDPVGVDVWHVSANQPLAQRVGLEEPLDGRADEIAHIGELLVTDIGHEVDDIDKPQFGGNLLKPIAQCFLPHEGVIIRFLAHVSSPLSMLHTGSCDS